MNTQLAWFILLVVCAALCTYLFFRTVPEQADVIYVNGRIYTMDATESVAEALAVRGGRIVAIGSRDELGKKIRAKDTVDLAGKTVFPGFTDAHGHLMSLGVAMLTVDLVGIQSDAQAATLVAM